MNTNHVDGEIWVPDDEPTPRMREEMQQVPALDKDAEWIKTRVPDGVTIKAAEPTDLDYRAAALNAALKWHQRVGGNLLAHAKYFESYLRGEAA